MRYSDTIIPKATVAFRSMRGPMHQFVNMYEYTPRLVILGVKTITDPVTFPDIHAAAVDAVEREDEYRGTVMINPDGSAVMLDLREHGERLAEEAAVDAATQEAAAREAFGHWSE